MNISPVAIHEKPLWFEEEQLKVFWTATEIKVEKDIQDMLVNMTEAEKHGVITTLKLFTLYELKAGEEYWGGRFKKIFPQVEYIRMASAFSMFELCVHMPFYSKINELLHIHTDVFYNSYVEDPTLKSRMEYIDEIVNSPDDLISLAGFSMVEGVILYSSFAFLKHFQSEGKNKLMNIVRGINFSVRDENLHSLAGAWAYRQLRFETYDGFKENQDYIDEIEQKIYKLANVLYEHECRTIDMTFEKGHIDGVTPTQMKNFVASRLDQCLVNIGLKKVFHIKYNPIANWFYKGINNFNFNDFFSGQGREYTRNWDEDGFTW